MEAAQKGVDVLISDSSLPISSTNPQLRMLAGIEIAQAARDASPSVHTVLHSGNVLESILEDVRYFSGDGDGENAVIPGGERAARFAQKKADALGDALSGRGYEVFDFLLRKGDDPGALTELMKTLLGSGQEKSRTR